MIVAVAAAATAARGGDIQLRTGAFSAEGYDVWEPSRKAGYSRVYCSEAPASWLGSGWKADWDERLVFSSDGNAPKQSGGPIVWDGFLCGDGVRFVPDPLKPGHYRGDLSSRQRLRRVGDGYELELEGLTIAFDSRGRKTRWWIRRDGPFFEILRTEAGAPREVRFGGEVLMRVVTDGKRVVRMETGKAAGGASVGKSVPFEYDSRGRLVRAVSAIGRIHNYSYGKGDLLTAVIEDGPGGDSVDERLEWGGGPVRGGAWAVRVRRDLISGRQERLLYSASDGRRWKTEVRVLREGRPKAIGTGTFEWETERSAQGSLRAKVVRNSVNGDRVEGSFSSEQAIPVAVRYGDHRRELGDVGPGASFDRAHLPPWLFPRWLKPEHLAARIWADAILRIEILDAQGRTRGTGSGFFISPDGVVATNFHVMEEVAEGKGGAHPRFVLPNGRIIEKYQVGHCQRSSRTDLCVLKLDHYPARYFDPRLGRSPPEEGTEIFSVGNAESKMMPAIRGIYRGSFDFRNAGWIEVSNEILPGDSGGPIFTWDGRLVGMSTIILFTVPRPARQARKQVHRDDTRLAMSAAEVSRVDELSPTFKAPERAFGGR